MNNMDPLYDVYASTMEMAGAYRELEESMRSIIKFRKELSDLDDGADSLSCTLDSVIVSMRAIAVLAERLPHPDDEAIEGLASKLSSAADSVKVLAENSQHIEDLS